MKNQWFISIKKNDGNIFNLDGLKHNYPPSGKYWADPFLYQRDGNDYIFYELFIYTFSIFLTLVSLRRFSSKLEANSENMIYGHT